MPDAVWIVLAVLVALLVVVVLYDVTQRHHAILRNFPIIGHLRYLLEMVGPELRQYIVTNNDEERPFNRDQRSWVYASSKRLNNYTGFGTDNELERASNYLIIKHAQFPLPDTAGHGTDIAVPCARVLGAARGRRGAFRPASIVNTSAMSFGSLSGPAVQAINRGALLAGCLQNTGEGSVTCHHRQGGELIWQIGTGYFGCRDERGRFDLARFKEQAAQGAVRAIEIKLSQGAKPGVGGFLPGAKVTPEIAAARGIPVGRDCASPPSHSAFSSVDEMLDFVELLAAESGLPVGIKSAVGEEAFWRDLARLMAGGERGVDFVTIDGGEGGTGAGPLVFTDHVALPFKLGFTRVYREFARQGVSDRVVWIGSGKLGFPDQALLAMALGCDLINVGREAMLAIGCIQAQRCHTGHCPTGVATQNRWLARGLDAELKAERLANYVRTLRQELLRLSHACGRVHPSLVGWEQFEILDGRFGTAPLSDVFGYGDDMGLPPLPDQEEIARLMAQNAH